MSNIEPTEEQRAAAHAWQAGVEHRVSGHPTLALFLAEREAKLTASIMKMWVAERTQLNERSDTLRARVAELEARAEGFVDLVLERQMLQEDLGIARADFATAVADLADAQIREAQHLADIKALRGMLQEARHVVEAHVPASGDEVDDESGVCEVSTLEAIDEELERTAHYSDAKADVPAGTEGEAG